MDPQHDMHDPSPQEHLGAYRQWCGQVALAIKDLDAWLVANDQATDETRSAIEVAQAGIHADRLTVGFVPGGGQGTSELINALFLHEYGQRLLPPYAGDASVCPTELCWDPAHTDAYLRLLPVETRALGIPFDKLRADPALWVEYPLNVQDAEKTVASLSEIAQTKVVSRATAARLGIDLVEPAPGGLAAEAPVEIPRWRYAILSVPIPLLQLGLVVLDVPVLDSRWREPELATELLAGAQSLVSVLAIGQEDGAADLDLRQYGRLGAAGSLVVALNKIDRLWSEGDGASVEPVIAKRRAAAAAALGVDEVQIFPVSAQKALIARMRGDTALLGATGIEALASHLLTELVRAGRQSHRGVLDQVLGGILDENRARISARMELAKSQLAELEEFRVKTTEAMGGPLRRIRQEQDVYQRSVKRLQACQEDLIRETGRCLEILNRDKFESLVVQTYTAMARSWTTFGMASAMQALFDELCSAMQAIVSEGERTPRLLSEMYSGFRRDFGFELSAPAVCFPMSLEVEIETLRHEADAFCHSRGIALARKGVVIERFRGTWVVRAQVLFDRLFDALDAWTRDALQPLAEQIAANKVVTERLSDDLQRLVHAKDDVQRRLNDAHRDYIALVHQLTALRNIHNVLRQGSVGEQSIREPVAPVEGLSAA